MRFSTKIPTSIAKNLSQVQTSWEKRQCSDSPQKPSSNSLSDQIKRASPCSRQICSQCKIGGRHKSAIPSNLCTDRSTHAWQLMMTMWLWLRSRRWKMCWRRHRWWKRDLSKEWHRRIFWLIVTCRLVMEQLDMDRGRWKTPSLWTFSRKSYKLVEMTTISGCQCWCATRCSRHRVRTPLTRRTSFTFLRAAASAVVLRSRIRAD